MPEDLRSVLVGMILGDGNINRSLTSVNARVQFRQGIAQSAFIYHLFDLFKDFIVTPPQIRTTSAKGKFKERQFIWIRTLSYTCFNFYFDRSFDRIIF